MGKAEECTELFSLASRKDQAMPIVHRNLEHLVVSGVSTQVAAIQTQESTIEASLESQSDAPTVRAAGAAVAVCLVPSFANGTDTCI